MFWESFETQRGTAITSCGWVRFKQTLLIFLSMCRHEGLHKQVSRFINESLSHACVLSSQQTLSEHKANDILHVHFGITIGC